ncbi:sensor histidine kinase [Rhodoferax mekongensis]|uniref:sensor histidine kinase n=1 Tax=Rhodoferax mekongensis TaxID=3068341 RepID=UPI0028BEC82A|nr:HAMP domain-containing sensor histidine kinase [Rhodoferax sp. TBRC 17199]MDT7514666.1 HAMP domain-containing sensor histidine kinase [Rhodoferax sp. TBRC 17199]
MTPVCPHSISSPLQGAVDAGLLLCEQPEVHAEVESLRAEVGLMQSLLDAGDQAVLTLTCAGECVPANSQAAMWWPQASLQERAELQQWALSTPGTIAECTQVWTHGSRKVLAVKRVQVAPAVVALYLRDITQAHDIDRMKSDFLSAAAHELRTPLASIYGFAELMLVRTLGPEKQKELLGTIHRQAKSLIDLINELLDLSRIEARQGKDLSIVSCPLAALVDSTVGGLHYKAEKHRLVCDLRHGAFMVMANPEKTRQALLNVLSNAVKYSPQGGTVTISTALRGVGGQQQVGVQVRDEGMGMDEAQCGRAFERFYRAHPLGDIPGTGLGLSLVQEIMQLQQGEAELSSVPGAGTTVTLWLPAQALLPDDAATADPHLMH